MKVTKCDKTPSKRLKLKSIAQASTSRALPELGFDPTTFQWLLNRFYRAFYHSLQHIIIDNNDVRLARKSSSSELHTSWPLTLLRLSLFHSPPLLLPVFVSYFSSGRPPLLILAFPWFLKKYKTPFLFFKFFPRRFLYILKALWCHQGAAPTAAVSVMSRASW